ncbi:MAG: glycosyltransferase [Candidatus Hodarchaeales archaeon]|jgi:glycosyltransferase involved in cell wall biosynthesis
MKKDLVSIVIPTYNDAQYLRQAVDDILNQTYEDFELIIVNDGSTDNTVEILEEYSTIDPRVKVFHKENGGTGSALNLGFSKATGEFGTWVSSDDNKETNFIEELVSFLKKNRDVEFVCSAFYSNYLKSIFKPYKKENDRFVFCNGLNHNSFLSGESIIVDDWADINYKACFQGVCFMFTMRLKNACGDYIEIPGEDYYMTMLMGLNSRIGYVDKMLGTHNNPVDSLSMMDRNCVAEANVKTRSLYLNSKRWKMNKIPKIASFYWGSDKMSFMRYLTIFSFKKQNPDWSIHLYVPKSVSDSISWLDKGADNHHKCDQVSYKGQDYYEKLLNDVPVKVIKVDFSNSFLTKEAPEPHKSDLLTWQVLATRGGLWCDMDIIFRKSMVTMFHKYDSSADTVLCYDNRLKCPDGTPEKPIGFMLSAPKNRFFNKALVESKKNYDDRSYQSIGTVTLMRIGRTIRECERLYNLNKFENIDPEDVYYFHHQMIDDIYNKSLEIPEKLIAIHWYGGHPLSQKFNNNINHENYLEFDNTISKIIKEVMS